MRLFQNFDIYPEYLSNLRRQHGNLSFEDTCKYLLFDRFIALHMLQPVLDGSADAAFAVGRDMQSQRDWARTQGMSHRSGLDEILIAQIEHHRTDVFYNLDPVRFGSDFVRKLPGCVKRKIAWRAAPSPGADFGAYDLVVCNFQSILQSYRSRGWRTAWFYPAFDPVMDEYAQNDDRNLDVVFAGTYSRHHRSRASVIEALADLGQRYKIKICLQRSRLTKLADRLPSWLPIVEDHKLPPRVKGVTGLPVFGRGLYDLFSSAKIVVNGSIDMAGLDRGNFRCWEALGCRALMLTDNGRYPGGMEVGRTMETYDSASDLLSKVERILGDEPRRQIVANSGYEMISSRYSKDRQWSDFMNFLD